jgi:hypothetical protein
LGSLAVGCIADAASRRWRRGRRIRKRSGADIVRLAIHSESLWLLLLVLGRKDESGFGVDVGVVVKGRTL